MDKRTFTCGNAPGLRVNLCWGFLTAFFFFWPFSPQGNLILLNWRLSHCPQATRWRSTGSSRMMGALLSNTI